MNTFMLELYKLSKRVEFKIILISLIFSFVLPASFAAAPSSYKIDYAFGSQIPLSGYIVLGYAFFGSFGLFTILFSILTTSLSSYEIESHYFYLYFPRVNNRTKIYTEKTMTISFFAVVWYIAYTLLLNPISYLLLSITRPDLASGIFSDGSLVYWLCMWIIFLVELLFYINVALFIGTCFKSLTAIVIDFAIFYGAMFLYNIPILQYIIPEYYKQAAIISEDLSEPMQLFVNVMLYVIICTVISGIVGVLGRKKYKRINA